MNRRFFLQLTLTGAGGIWMAPYSLATLRTGNSDIHNNENILVFVQLNGGNDGLNTYIPFNDPLYYLNRPTIGVSKDKVINATNGMGFHPALKHFASIQQDGNLTVIQNTGYPNPNRSHFRSQEIWQTASDSQQYLDYGWLGRFLDTQNNDENLPSLNLDSTDNLALKAATRNGITVKDFSKINSYLNSDPEYKLSDNPQLDFVRKLQYNSTEGMGDVKKALQNAQKYNEVYANTPLSQNLQWIAKLIKGQLNSKIYYTSLNGFDTHNNQVPMHQRQLGILNDAVYSFYQDMKSNNLMSNITLVVFSEFGRRVKENGSGTDHGTAGPMFIIGGNNKGNAIGKNPDLSRLDKGDLVYETDFRSVYATLLQKKYNFDPKTIGIHNEVIEGIF